MSDRTRHTEPGKPEPYDQVLGHNGRALLQVWLSPSFPVGAFAYSHGLEKAVERGWIGSRATLETWLLDIVVHGGLRNDLIFIGEAYRAASTSDHVALRRLADLSAALQPSAERYLEATQQGHSFLLQIDAAWPMAHQPLAAVFADARPTLSVVLGVAAQAHRIASDDAARAYAISFASNLISAAIRLSVVGHTDGQRIMAAVLPALMAAAVRAGHCGMNDLGGAAFRSDIASQQHETQYTRLFRS